MSSPSTDPTTDAIFSLIFIGMSVGFTCFGVFALRRPARIAAFFHATGSRMFGSSLAGRVYTERNFKLTGWMFVVIGPIFVVVGVWAAITIFAKLG